MRNGQNKRMRGRPRKNQNPLTRVYESNGPDVKIRGTASHIAEKYLQLARDAQSSGDPVGAENYYQHAEHYFRLIAAVNEQFRQNQPFQQDQREGGYDEDEDMGGEQGQNEPYAAREQGQPYPPRDNREHQPYGGREQRFPPRERDQYRGEREGGRDFRDRDQRDFRDRDQPREQRDYRERDNRDNRERENREAREPQGAPAPSESAAEDTVGELPAFLTAGAAPVNGGFHANGADGGGERFPVNRRRRRRGPRDNQSHAEGEEVVRQED